MGRTEIYGQRMYINTEVFKNLSTEDIFFKFVIATKLCTSKLLTQSCKSNYIAVEVNVCPMQHIGQELTVKDRWTYKRIVNQTSNLWNSMKDRLHKEAL